MKLGIIGLSQSGKNTIFRTLTNNVINKNGLATVNVKDTRIDRLNDIYSPRKKVYAQVEYFLPNKKKYEQKTIVKVDWSQIRDCNALVHVVRNFDTNGLENPSLLRDFNLINQELILSDIMVVEKRLEQLSINAKKGKKDNLEELPILEKCLEILEEEKPLRHITAITTNKILKGYSFLSAKPMLILVNSNDNNDQISEESPIFQEGNCMVIKAKLEQELAQMTVEEAQEFFTEFKISNDTTYQVIKMSYAALGLISFFTVGADEVRAWTVRANTKAIDAAEVIHSDIRKGFIRAEVVSYANLMEAGNYNEARKRGTVRVEAKSYVVNDGDIINFRFNV